MNAGTKGAGMWIVPIDLDVGKDHHESWVTVLYCQHSDGRPHRIGFPHGRESQMTFRGAIVTRQTWEAAGGRESDLIEIMPPVTRLPDGPYGPFGISKKAPE